MSDLELDNLAETLRNVGTRHLFTLRLEVSPILNVGPTPGANRRMGVITGGEFRGQRLRGAVLSGGSDWISMRTDGSLDLNVRLILKTDDDALVAMTYHGIRSGSPETLGQLARGMEVD